MHPIGVLIHAGGTSSPTPYYTPWTGRGGNAAVFVADIISMHLTSTGAGYKVIITVQTKNSQQDDSAATALGVFADIDSLPTTPPTKYLSGCLELYRFKIEVYGNISDDWVHMRMLEPSWQRN